MIYIYIYVSIYKYIKTNRYLFNVYKYMHKCMYKIFISLTLSCLRQMFRSGPWEDGLQKMSYSSFCVTGDILRDYAIRFTNNLLCRANFQKT